MYCPKCGKPNPDTSQFCISCAQALSAQFPPPPGSAAGAGIAPPLTPSATDTKAIASLICGLLSFIFPAAVAAIILGHISRSDIRKSGGRLTGSGLAMTGLVFGYLGVSVIPILIIAAIAIPNLLRARITANEASAVASIRAINTAEIAYVASHPEAGYTCSLPDLNNPPGMIEGLVGGERHGYVFRIQGCTPKTYTVIAVPVAPSQTGYRAFCSREDAVIRFDRNGSGVDCLAHGQEVQSKEL
jgi:type IV pilus assembly protein PilA